MANPRQRRKARSSAQKVRLSKHANSRLKKVTPHNIPAALAGAFNPKETPMQNYRRLGLLSGKLAPRLAGGIEKDTSLAKSWLARKKTADEFDVLRAADEEDESGDEEPTSEEDELGSEQAQSYRSESPKLAKGEGRIIRDENGKILKVIIGDEQEIEVDPKTQNSSTIVIKRSAPARTSTTPWGKPFEAQSFEQEALTVKPAASSSGKVVLQGIGYDNPRIGAVPPKTPFVAELERISYQRSILHTEQVKEKRYLSANQVNWLTKLINKHGLENADLMARDIKLNTHQKTEGEIRHMLQKLPKSTLTS